MKSTLKESRIAIAKLLLELFGKSQKGNDTFILADRLEKVFREISEATWGGFLRNGFSLSQAELEVVMNYVRARASSEGGFECLARARATAFVDLLKSDEFSLLLQSSKAPDSLIEWSKASPLPQESTSARSRTPLLARQVRESDERVPATTKPATTKPESQSKTPPPTPAREKPAKKASKPKQTSPKPREEPSKPETPPSGAMSHATAISDRVCVDAQKLQARHSFLKAYFDRMNLKAQMAYTPECSAITLGYRIRRDESTSDVELVVEAAKGKTSLPAPLVARIENSFGEICRHFPASIWS